MPTHKDDMGAVDDVDVSHVPPPPPQPPHIPAQDYHHHHAQHLGGASPSTSLHPSPVADFIDATNTSVTNPDQKRERKRSRRFAKSVFQQTPGTKLLAKNQRADIPVASTAEGLKEIGVKKPEERSGRRKALGRNELSELAAWTIFETPGSRSTRAARGDLKSSVGKEVVKKDSTRGTVHKKKASGVAQTVGKEEQLHEGFHHSKSNARSKSLKRSRSSSRVDQKPTQTQPVLPPKEALLKKLSAHQSPDLPALEATANTTLQGDQVGKHLEGNRNETAIETSKQKPKRVRNRLGNRELDALRVWTIKDSTLVEKVPVLDSAESEIKPRRDSFDHSSVPASKPTIPFPEHNPKPTASSVTPDSDEDQLPANTICVSSFLSDEDIKELMPDLDEAVLTRARRRAEGPRAERLMSRRASSAQAEINGVRRNSVVNGVRAASVLRTPAPVNGMASPPSKHRATSTTTQVDYTQATDSRKSSSAKQSGPQDAPKRKKEEKPLERNIDNVVFGDVSFKAWYPSWYPKEIIGEKGLAGDAKGIVVSELYVCNQCFAYSKSPVDWVRHTRCCEKDIPGEKIYSHGSEGAWSIWEVDGDVDTLFCQNLSLFAKLFLDNKSVFFDVSGFKYFLLVHTREVPLKDPAISGPIIQNRVVGFFSKEKMSWDNNNLACILVFPPWQKKSLGSLLMGISYAISRRERVLGGPEKPISELGRKGYKRFWGAEIARWLLDQKENDKKGKGSVFTVTDVSQGTWIVADDCLSVLREMDVVERVKGGDEEGVRLDKEKVRAWVAKMNINLNRVVDEEGFVEGYAIAEEEVQEEEDDVEMVEE